MDKKKTLLACGLLLAGASAVVAFIFLTEPTASQTGAVRETAMLVDVTGVERGTFVPTIRAMGTVEPSQDVVLSPRVGGEVILRSPAFTPGGYVRKGDLLLQIDPADYENALAQRRSDLEQAISDVRIEMGRQDVAREDYRLLSDTLSGENEELVLRQPQLDAAEARVEAARAAVRQAQLALDRTTIRAPFDAHILSREVTVGSQVAPGNELGRLVGLDAYWVAATVPLGQLRWLTIPTGGSAEGSPATIRNPSAWPEGASREGRLHRLVGTLEDGTRMARVLIEVPDPHRGVGSADVPPLLIGSFVEASIEARPLDDVVRLSRDYVRSGDTVWVMAEDSTLQIRDVEIAFRDAVYAYITRGLDAGERVVTTNLASVVDGARLRVEGAGDAGPAPGQTAAASGR